jgi:hypothetical protein
MNTKKYYILLSLLIVFFAFALAPDDAEAVCVPACQSPEQCMPISCNDQLPAPDRVVYECHDPNLSKEGYEGLKWSDYQYSSAEVERCKIYGSSSANSVRETRLQTLMAGEKTKEGEKAGAVCSSDADCEEGLKCLPSWCDFAKKEVINKCYLSGEKPTMSEEDIKACKAGTFEAKVKEERECKEKAPPETERGVFTRGLSDLCLGCGKCSQCDFFQVIANIATFIFEIAGGLAVVVLIISGFLYMTAAGSQERMQRAKQALTAAIIGIIIVLGAWLLVNFVVTTLGYNLGSWFAPNLNCG